jgi:YHS domain-containing protein
MILRLLIAAVVIYILFRLFRKRAPQMGGKDAPAQIRTAAAGEDLVEDPICHTYVPIGDACRLKMDGKTVHFCSPKCLEQYKSEHKR